jgi:ATP-binding cassette subfamily B protein
MRSLFRLRPFVRPYWKQVLLALLALTLLTALKLVVPLIIRQVIDQGLTNGDVRLIVTAALSLLVIGLASAALIYWQRYQTEIIAAQIGYDLRNRLYNHIQRLPFTFHDHSQTGQLISRTIEDVRSIERFAGNGIVELIHLFMLFTGTLS